MITIESLISIIDQFEHESSKSRVASLLLTAITDWPRSVNTVEEYLDQVKEALQISIIDRHNLEMGIKTLSPGNHSWEIESITGLIKIFHLTTEELDTVIKQLK
jgi:hypothetical protein